MFLLLTIFAFAEEIDELIKRVNSLNQTTQIKITFLHQRINDLQNKMNHINDDLRNITIAFIFIDGIILFMIYLILHGISN